MIAWEKEKRDKLNRIIAKYSTNKAPPIAVPSSVHPLPPRRPFPPKPNYNEENYHHSSTENLIPRGQSQNYGCNEMMDEFCANSTIHGIKYIGDRKRHWAERLWWLIAFVLCIGGCSNLIVHIWKRWDRNPVIVSFAEKTTPIYSIPFPAVTICMETKTQSDLFNYTHWFHVVRRIDLGEIPNNLTAEEIYKIDALGQVCEPNRDNTSVGTSFTTPRVVDILKELTPRLDSPLFLCRWRNEPMPCGDIFSEILTEEGICYTFNNLEQEKIFRKKNLHTDFRYIEKGDGVSSWSVEKGYPKNSTLATYPERVQTAGARAGLSIILPMSTYDKDYLCRGPSQGFKVQLHTPGEIPHLSQQFFRLSLDQEIVISVKPNMITTSRILKSYDISRRMCYFENEKYLRFFRTYSQQNCELECLTNYTLHKCGCVKFSMPRDANTSMCGSKKRKCFYDAEDELLNPYEGTPGQETGCNCLPTCTSISYEAETSQADFDWRPFVLAHGATEGSFPGEQLARVMIFFRDSQFITSKRSELYGPTDFLANAGGLLGLFMGVSILSLVEVVYFFTIRVWFRMRKQQTQISRRVSFIGNAA